MLASEELREGESPHTSGSVVGAEPAMAPPTITGLLGADSSGCSLARSLFPTHPNPSFLCLVWKASEPPSRCQSISC